MKRFELYDNSSRRRRRIVIALAAIFTAGVWTWGAWEREKPHPPPPGVVVGEPGETITDTANRLIVEQRKAREQGQPTIIPAPLPPTERKTPDAGQFTPTPYDPNGPRAAPLRDARTIKPGEVIRFGDFPTVATTGERK